MAKKDTEYGPVVYGTVHDDMARAHHRGDWKTVADWLSKRFGIEVTEEFVKMEKKPGSLFGKFSCWSSATMAMWWKTRLEEAGRFTIGKTLAKRINLPVPLHIFFWAIEETDEMVAILKNEAMVHDAVPQTPAIERTLHRPEPINAAAARVTGFRTSGNADKPSAGS